MGKNKRHQISSRSTKSTPHKLTRPASISKAHPSSKSTSKPNPGKPHHKQLQHTAPTIPFSPSDRILLIGEGDLSFALSLIKHHDCKDVIATVLESEQELREKYPHVIDNILAIEEGGGVLKYGVDASKVRDRGWKRMGGQDRIFFNFPHVGGKSRDVNRQVRYNQELLVSFFRTAIPSLSPKPGASIIVTLFEGEPYTLWNIRDLGRHAGLEVKESFKFQAAAYPGYKHARTIGVIREKGKGGNREMGDGENERHGWRGEERKARSYVFVRKGEGEVQGLGKKRVESDDEDDDTDEAGIENQREAGEDDEGIDEEEDNIIQSGETEDSVAIEKGKSEDSKGSEDTDEEG